MAQLSPVVARAQGLAVSLTRLAWLPDSGATMEVLLLEDLGLGRVKQMFL